MSTEALFWDVDTQYDFIYPDGRLPVPGGPAIVPNLAGLTEFAGRNRIPVVASGDAHPPDDPEFQEFGPHCVAGSAGQRKIEETSLRNRETAVADALDGQLGRLRDGELDQLFIEKQELDVFSESAADAAVRRLDPDRVYVYGVATEYCVLRTVLGLRERGCPVTLVSDAVKAIGQEAGREAVARMRAAGAALADTGTVLHKLSEG